MERENAYRYRCYPNASQRRELARTFGAARFLYNWALRMRTDALSERGERVSKKREGHEWMNEVSSVPMQQALRHLDTAYRNFFAGRAKYPTFHKKHGKQSAEYTTSAFRFRDGKLFLAKMDAPLKMRWSRSLPPGAKVTTVTISMDSAGRSFVSLRFTRAIQPMQPASGAVGIDAGIESLVTLSTGEQVHNPRHANRDARKLAHAQRKLRRCQKGSKRREKQRKRVARIHARIADRRRDHLHKPPPG